MQSCDEQFIFFTDIVNEIFEKYLPLNRVMADSSDKPWITSEIKSLIIKRQRAWSRENNITFKHYRNMVNARCKAGRNSYYKRNIADVQQSNPKKWWSALKKIAGLSSSRSTKTLMYNNRKEWRWRISWQVQRQICCCWVDPSTTWSDSASRWGLSIRNHHIRWRCRSSLLSAKLHSAAGPYEMSAWFLRENASTLCRPNLRFQSVPPSRLCPFLVEIS